MGAYFKSIFSIDLRTLTFFRIGYGLVLLIDIINRSFDFKAHYTEAGIAPLATEKANGLYFNGLFDWNFSIFFLSSSDFFQTFLFACGVGIAFALIVGFKPRLFSLLAWFFLTSLYARNISITDYGDLVFLALSFWAVFLPLPCSKTSWQKGSYYSAATAGVTLQIVCLYVFGVLHKSGASWRSDLSAVYEVLSFDQHAQSLAHFLLQFPQLTKFMTFGTMVLEGLLILLLFVPTKKFYLRSFLVLSFWGFHLGLGLSIVLGVFVPICLLMWSLMIPTEFWERFFPSLSSKTVASDNWFDQPQMRKVLWLFVLLMVFTNFNSLQVQPWRLPEPLHWLASKTFLKQTWNMYAPSPPIADGWLVAKGTLSDGSPINALYGNQPLSFEKPKFVSDIFLYGNQRWANFMSSLDMLTEESAEPDWNNHYMTRLGQFLCDRFSKNYRVHGPLQSIDLFFMAETTPPMGQPARLERHHIWIQDCY